MIAIKMVIKFSNERIEEEKARYKDPNLTGYYAFMIFASVICLLPLMTAASCMPNTIANICSPTWGVVRSFIPVTFQ
jgi:hypothetical protein